MMGIEPGAGNKSISKGDLFNVKVEKVLADRAVVPTVLRVRKQLSRLRSIPDKAAVSSCRTRHFA